MIALIRQGLLCRDCTGRKCYDEGTEAEPISIECPHCNGRECKHCVGGFVNLNGCPNAFCRDMASIIDLVEIFRNGTPPLPGGSLNQTRWFLDVAQQLNADENKLKAEKHR